MDCSGKRIVVLGGGNAAVDVARSAVRLGAEDVIILYRRTRNEMPAYEEEIDGALEEGIKLVTLGIPKRIISKGQTVRAVEYLKAELGETDIDGRKRPVPIEGSETTIQCDIVIPAIGQIASTESVNVSGGPELTKWGTIKIDPVEFKTTVDSIFAGGDCVTGPASVIGAIAAGQKAAVSIDKKLGGSGNLPQDIGFSFTKPDEETLAQLPPRPEEKNIPLEERKRGFAEVVLGLDRSLALAEAGRCLRCDLEK
jgi:NADPH-dependent glutamate synthase beta subunit-like oxidoreductase